MALTSGNVDASDNRCSSTCTCALPKLDCVLTGASKLDPRLSEAEQYDIIKASTDTVFPLPVMTSPSKKDTVVSCVPHSLPALAGMQSYTIVHVHVHMYTDTVHVHVFK